MNIFDDFEHLNFDEPQLEEDVVVSSSTVGFNIFNKFETLNVLNFDEIIWTNEPGVQVIADNSSHHVSSENTSAQLIIASRIVTVTGTTPATPLSGRTVLYCKDDGLFYHKSNDGIEHPLSLPVGGVGLAYQSTDKPTADAEVSVLLPYSVIFPADLTGATYYAAAAPSTTVTVSIKLNNTQFGMLEVSTSNTATFTATQTTCAAGDRISFAFGAQDSTWSGVAITLKGLRV